MFNKLTKLDFRKKRNKDKEVTKLLELATKKCKEHNLHVFNLCNYKYDSDEAMQELGLDDDLIHQLIEDYVAQIIRTKSQYLLLLQKLNAQKEINKTLDFQEFRDLAHKNLGVARNLRIEDARDILSKMMKSENLEELENLVELLDACAIKLKPYTAYDTIKLIDIKNRL